jgi:hypothetical protein
MAVEALSPRAFADSLHAGVRARRSLHAGCPSPEERALLADLYGEETRQRSFLEGAVDTLAHWWQRFDGIERDLDAASRRS